MKYESNGNQEMVLIGAFSVIVQTDGSFAALVTTETEERRHPASRLLCNK